jgi:flagellar biosynthesis/type III secretory pathway M-ring protein FliF/YscJ
MDSDIGGWLWLMIDVIFVAALALALVYGTIRWRTRRRNRDVEKAVGQAIKRMYERESEDEQRLDVPSALAFRAMAMVRYNAR